MPAWRNEYHFHLGDHGRGELISCPWCRASGILDPVSSPQIIKLFMLPLLKEGSRHDHEGLMLLPKSGFPVLATVGFEWLCKTSSMPSRAVGFMKCPAVL